MNIVHQRGRTEGLGGLDMGPNMGHNNYSGFLNQYIISVHVFLWYLTLRRTKSLAVDLGSSSYCFIFV